MNILKIDPAWEFGTAETNTAFTFNFYTTNNCPGYSVEISKWRLRRGDAFEIDALPNVLRSALEGLKRVLGDHYLQPIKDLKARAVIDDTSRSVLRRGPNHISSENFRMMMEEEIIKLSLSPRVAPFFIPLMTLIGRDHHHYSISEELWTDDHPPTELHHLAQSGFNGKAQWGVLALTAKSNDPWIVSRFTKCKVSYKHRPKSASNVDWPELTKMAEQLSTMQNVILATHQLAKGIPSLVDKATEADERPLAAADEARRQMPLSRAEHEIRDAIIQHGTGKAAAASLGISASTLCRRKKMIRQKMKHAGFREEVIFRPAVGFKKHGDRREDDGSISPTDIEQTVSDWREDPNMRTRCIEEYLSASPSDQKTMREYWPDIDAEAKEARRSKRQMKFR